MTTHFFLGANSGEGFQNLYGGIADLKDTQDFLILKGGAGVGKATFMKQIGRAAEEAGAEVEYVWCSGDPESLDALLLPEYRVVIADGTSPHVIEPKFPAAVDRYVNLGRFYDVMEIKKSREAVIAYTETYQAGYQRAFRCLKAARQVEVDANVVQQKAMDWQRLDRRITGIIARELRKKGGQAGKTSYRFLGSMSYQGYVWRHDSVENLCPRVYELADCSELGTGALLRLHSAARAAGYDTIVCLNPEEKEKPQHLLIPKLGLAFVTANDDMAYPGKAYRRLRLDTMSEGGEKARGRFARRMADTLRQEAHAALGQAKAAHDELERVYNPHVDFDGVRALAREETERILSYPKRT